MTTLQVVFNVIKHFSHLVKFNVRQIFSRKCTIKNGRVPKPAFEVAVILNGFSLTPPEYYLLQTMFPGASMICSLTVRYTAEEQAYQNINYIDVKYNKIVKNSKRYEKKKKKIHLLFSRCLIFEVKQFEVY